MNRSLAATASTSKRAYDDTRPYMPNKRERIYRFIQSKGVFGATADEFYEQTGQTHTGNGTLFYDLAAMGFIEQSKSERERETRTGRMAVVWMTTDKELTEGCFSNPYYAHLHPAKVSKTTDNAVRNAAKDVLAAWDAKDREGFRSAIAGLREAIGQ